MNDRDVFYGLSISFKVRLDSFHLEENFTAVMILTSAYKLSSPWETWGCGSTRRKTHDPNNFNALFTICIRL